MDVPATHSQFNPNEHFIDAQQDEAGHLDAEYLGEPGFPVDIIVGLVIGLHDEVENEEGIDDRGDDMVDCFESRVIKDDDVHMDEGQCVHEYFPVYAGLEVVDAFIETLFLGVDDVEAGLLVPQSVL